jgi:hypothetical protein
MTTRIMVRNLALIKHLLANHGNEHNPEIQQTLNSLNFVWEQHILQVRECIELLEGIREKEEVVGRKEQVSSVIKSLHHLI